MRQTLSLLGILALSLTAARPARACDGEMETAQSKAPHKVTIQEVAAWQAKKTAFTPVDVNSAATRAKNGVLPGAVLLSSAAEYEPSKELPGAKDAKLVFYCGGLKCGASTTAAQKAIDAGYSDVNVLPDGISGWKNAGKQTQAAPQS